MKILNKNINGGLMFLLTIVFLYIIVGLFNFNLLIDLLIEFKTIFFKIFPIILFVFFLMYLFNIFINPKFVSKYLGKEKGLSGWVFSIVSGIISMGAIYMWYPILADLKEKGMKDGLISVFLYNMAIKIPLLPFMVFYFGLSFTIVLTIFMIIFSIINGVLIEKIMD